MNNNYKKENDFDVGDYKSLLDAAGQAALISMTDLKGDIIFVNDKFIKVAKYSRDELIGQNHRILKSGKQPQEMFDTLWKTVSSGKIWRGEIMNRAKDGTYYWVDSTIAPILGSDGKPARYIAVRFLISDKKEAERTNKAVLNVLEDLKEEREKLTQISDRLNLATKSAQIGVWEWDVIKNILTWDDQMYALYGIKKEDFGGAYEAWQKGLHPDDKKPGDDAIQAALKGKKDFKMQFRVLWPSGGIRYIQAYADVERDKAGRPLKMVGVNWDITKEKEIEQVKTDFLSIASHQLRTPLGAMRWNLEMLINGDHGKLPDEAVDVVKDVEENNSRMLSLVNNLLDVSRIDQQRVADQPVDVNIPSLIKGVIEELKNIAKERSVAISFENKMSDDFVAKLDKSRIHEVVTNLLSNAIKYNKPNGTIVIRISKQDDMFSIEVQDTGMGIPDKDRHSLFSRFYRASNAVSSDTEGSGLGLFVVKSYVQSWGGRVDFESKLDEGTTFKIELPLEPKSNTLSVNLKDNPHKTEA